MRPRTSSRPARPRFAAARARAGAAGDAIRALRTIVLGRPPGTRDPRSPAGAAWRAEAAVRRGDLRAALDALDAALAAHPEHPLLLERRVAVLDALGDEAAWATTVARLLRVRGDATLDERDRARVGELLVADPRWRPRIPPIARRHGERPVAVLLVLPVPGAEPARGHLDATRRQATRARADGLAARVVVIGPPGPPGLPAADAEPGLQLEPPLSEPLDTALRQQAWLAAVTLVDAGATATCVAGGWTAALVAAEVRAATGVPALAVVERGDAPPPDHPAATTWAARLAELEAVVADPGVGRPAAVPAGRWVEAGPEEVADAVAARLGALAAGGAAVPADGAGA